MPLRIRNATVHAKEAKKGQKMAFIQGALCLESVKQVKIASYQRSEHEKKEVQRIAEAFLSGERVATIELSTRGDKIDWDGDDILIYDPTNAVDGQGRIAGAELAHEINPNKEFLALVTVETSTTFHKERRDFLNFNGKRKGVSSNEILRNMAYDFPVLMAIKKLTEENPAFPFYRRVVWQQRAPYRHMTKALSFVKSITALHGHWGVSGANSAEDVVQALQSLQDRIGEEVLFENIWDFAKALDVAYGLVNRIEDDHETVPYGKKLVHTQGGFLWAIATMFADNFEHSDLWCGNRLCISPDVITNKLRLKKIELGNPEIMRLASSSGATRGDLIKEMTRWINSGKRTKQLCLNPKRLSGIKETYISPVSHN